MPNKMHKRFTITLLLWLIASSLLWSNGTSMDAPLLAEERELEEERLAQQRHQQESKGASGSSHDALPSGSSTAVDQERISSNSGRGGGTQLVVDPAQIKTISFNDAAVDLATGEQLGPVRDGPGRVKKTGERQQQDRPIVTDYDRAVEANLPVGGEFLHNTSTIL